MSTFLRLVKSIGSAECEYTMRGRKKQTEDPIEIPKIPDSCRQTAKAKTRAKSSSHDQTIEIGIHFTEITHNFFAELFGFFFPSTAFG